MSCLITKPTKWLCAQRRLRSAWASAHSDQSSLCTQWVSKDPSNLHVDSENTDQNRRMPRLIWVFAGTTTTLLVLSWGGSNMCLEVEKKGFFLHFNTFFIFLTQISWTWQHCSELQRLSYSIALSNFLNFVPKNKNRTFCATGICYEGDGLSTVI